MVDLTIRWWDLRREDLLALTEQAPIYVYNDETMNEIFFDLLSMDALQGLYYPYGLNPCPEMLHKAFDLGADFRCNSFAEIACLQNMFPKIDPGRICLLTGAAHEMDCKRTIDSGVQIGMNVEKDVLVTGNESPHTFQNGTTFAFMDKGLDMPAAPFSKGAVRRLYTDCEAWFSGEDHLNEKARYFKRLLCYFQNVSGLILGNTVSGEGRAFDQIMDMPQMEAYLQGIQDALPEVRLYLEPPPTWVAYAGGLLVKIRDMHMPEVSGPTGICMDVDPAWLASIQGSERPRLMVGVNLSRPDEHDLVLTHVHPKEWQVEGGRVEAGDMLFLAHMGAHGPGEVRTAAGRNGLPEHYLRARSMCPVKL